jgi:rifampin ADP-ribosylating transferase
MKVQQCFYGTRVDLSPGEEIRPDGGELFCTRELDAAIWAAELADGEGLPRVYRVAPKGSLVDLSESP